GPALTCANPRHRVNRHDPHLPVTDLSSLGGFDDDFDDVVGVVVIDQYFHANLRHQIDLVFGASIDLGVPPLPAVTACLAHGHAGHTEALEGDLHVVQFERFDDRGDELHAST